MSKSTISALICILIAIIAGVLLWKPSDPRRQKKVASFAECSQAGYPVMASYPRQCTAPLEGIFVEPSISEYCNSDNNCSTNMYCDHGACKQVVLDASCKIDEDCKLVNKNLNYACCWAGVCDEVDYSKDNWVAVNKDLFSAERSQTCPAKSSCGPTPGCPREIINDAYQARCSSGQCVKYNVIK
jgi:hypothetical protein